MRRIKGLENITCEDKFKELEWLSQEGKKLKENLVTIFKHIEGSFRKEGMNLFFRPTFARK